MVRFRGPLVALSVGAAAAAAVVSDSYLFVSASQVGLDAGKTAPNLLHCNNEPQELPCLSYEPSPANSNSSEYCAQQSSAITKDLSTKFNQELNSRAPLSRLVLGESSGDLFARASRLEKSIDYLVDDVWHNSGDARTREFPFIGAGPWKLLYATGVYLLLIKHLLPKLMHFKRNGFELAWPLRVYNLAMVLANLFAFVHGARILSWGTKCFGCQLVDPNDKSEQTMELLHYGWLFLMSRLIEWLDTIFFVLRKRERQITKLHVFHHSFVPLLSWTYLKYHPSYTMAFFPFINSFVHSIMYSYYFLATFGSKVQPYLWWKRYLTSIQMTQFVLILIQLATVPLSADERCNYPRGFIYFAFAGAVLFLWLFYAYYIDTYTKKPNRRLNNNQHNSKPEAKEKNNQRSTNVIENQGRTLKEVKRGREGYSKAVNDLLENSIETF